MQPARPTFTARLTRKLLLSEPAQCYHLEFACEAVTELHFAPGQFISCVAETSAGRQQTRAYSLASAPRRNQFDLCVNRVRGGFFSNRLCDLREGETMTCHGPHGTFTLHEPAAPALLIAADTGIAPLRGLMQWMFPDEGPDRSGGREVWLVFGAGRGADLFYGDEFARLAAAYPNFCYLPTVTAPDERWRGALGTVEDEAARLVADEPLLQRQAGAAQPLEQRSDQPFDVYAYVCGLNAMVAPVRARLASLGWHRKQIFFERYD